jgi:hypothetical protein
MALAFGLQAGGYTPTELTTEAAVTLEPEGQGFRISRSVLTLRAQAPNLDEATLRRLPKTTIMSIGHRSAVVRLHQRHLEMCPEAIISRCTIRRGSWRPWSDRVQATCVPHEENSCMLGGHPLRALLRTAQQE